MVKQIPFLDELAQADADDLLLIRDVDAGIDKKISYQNAFPEVDAEIIGSVIHGASGKTTLAGSDEIPIIDTESDNSLKIITLDDFYTHISSLIGAPVVLKGAWDAGESSFPGGDAAKAGWSYIVSIGGTVDGVAFAANDRILAIADNASSETYSGNWHKLDYTDQVLSVHGRTGTIVSQSGDYNADQIDETANNKIMTSAERGKLANIEAQADVTDSDNVNAAGAVMESDYNVQSVLIATTTTTPLPVTIGASNFVGRKASGDAGVMTAAEARAVLNVENGATADQAAAEIKTAYESNADTNAFTDAEQTKLGGIETGAEVNNDTDISVVLFSSSVQITSSTGDGDTIPAANFGDGDAGVMSAVQAGKLDDIEANADVTDAANVNAAGAVMESDYNAQTLLIAVADNTPLPVIVGASQFVGRKATGDVGVMSAAEARAVLNVENGAAADQTAGEVKTLYESNANTNAFTDAEKSKLASIELSANLLSRISGFIPSPVLATDRTASAITFSPGTYWDGTTLYTLASPLTKLANVAFAPGNNAGGIHSQGEDSFVSCHLIIDGSGNLDVCLTGSVTGSSVPDGFTHLTRLVSFTTYSTYYSDIVNKTLPQFNAFEEPDGSILIQYGYDGPNMNPAIISDRINPGTGVQNPTKGSNLIQTPLQSIEYLVLAYLEDATASTATRLEVWGGGFAGNGDFRLGGKDFDKTSEFAELLIPAVGGSFAFAQMQCWLRPPLYHKLSSSTADHRVILRKIAIRDRRLD
jgi:hypothetical protein